MTTLEANIASLRSQNPLQPIPFELFPEFCQSVIQGYYKDKEAVFSQLSDAQPETEQKVSEKYIKSPDNVKLSGALRLYGRIIEDCIKLDRGLKNLKKKMDHLESDVKELEALGELLRMKAVKYARPNAKKVEQKIVELEQMEKELLNVVFERNEEEAM